MVEASFNFVNIFSYRFGNLEIHWRSFHSGQLSGWDQVCINRNKSFGINLQPMIVNGSAILTCEVEI